MLLAHTNKLSELLNTAEWSTIEPVKSVVLRWYGCFSSWFLHFNFFWKQFTVFSAACPFFYGCSVCIFFLYTRLVLHKIAFACFNILSIQFLWVQLVRSNECQWLQLYYHQYYCYWLFLQTLLQAHFYNKSTCWLYLSVFFFVFGRVLCVHIVDSRWGRIRQWRNSNRLYLFWSGWLFQFDQKYFLNIRSIPLSFLYLFTQPFWKKETTIIHFVALLCEFST